MAEEIELRKLRPGQVVELPPDMLVGTADQELKFKVKIESKVAVYSGNETTVGKKFYPYFQVEHPIRGGEFLKFAGAAIEPGTKFKLASEAAASRLTDVIKGQMKKATISLGHTATIISGTDPEIFIVNGKDELIPAWDVLPDEDASSKIHGLGKTKRFWDGFQAEFCPVQMVCLQELMENVRNGLSAVLGDARVKHPDAKFSMRSEMFVSPKMLEAADFDKVQFRCTPSFNVYHDPGTEKPDARKYTYRFAGGHLHAGIKRSSDVVIEEIIRALDAIVGVAGVSLAEGMDSPLRRTMYGRAGEFRLPDHGIEYRVLSNFWLCSPAIFHLVFELFRQAIRLAESGMFNLVWMADPEQIREVINNNDVKTARAMLAANQHVLLGMLKQRWNDYRYLDIPSSHSKVNQGVAEAGVETILGGVGTVIKDPLDVEKNWHLTDGQWLRMGALGGSLWRNVK